MEKLKQIITVYPKNACPCCHHSNFVVVEKNVDAYVTGRDGEIIDHRELECSAIGRCINCGNEFHIDKIEIEKGGCNPAPVEEKEETDNAIIINQNYVDSYKIKFENWNGPVK